MKRTALMILTAFITSLVSAQQNNAKNTGIRTEHGLIYPIENEAEIQEITDIVEVKPDKDGVFYVVETRPEFPGGMEALMKYLKDNTRYPAICKEQGIQGRVIVQFVINPDSTISDIQVIKPVNPHLDKEATRVVKAMPKWKPGEQRGVPVKVRFTLPVTFRLPKEETVKTDSLTTSINK